MIIKNILIGVRIFTIMIAFCCCLIAISKIDFLCYPSGIISTILVLLLMASSNLINDIYDIKTDAINRPNRPLIKNPQLLNIFKAISLICIALSLGLSFLINFKAQLVIFCSIPILIFYSKLFKSIPIIGNLVVASYLSLVFIFIELAVTAKLDIMIVPAFFAFGISLIREIIKDIEDYKGDYKAGLKTLPILVGVKQSIFSAILLILCFIIASFFIALNNFYTYSIISLFLLVFMPLFYLIFFLIKNPTVESCGEASKLLKKSLFLD